ncbi:hypothetical protein PV433_03775 [Paenibacillus sp. GYB004]|uniref:hypothetical protein n=1 Tax=Paenibacillus sp. GYB004 TaxID=2994393 RepID=UPI002F9616A7
MRIASVQSRQWNLRSPRKHFEAIRVREPLFAAWFVVLGTLRQDVDEGHLWIIYDKAAVRQSLLRYRIVE